MRLAALFTVYDGLELLGKAIDACYNHVDEIVLCYQAVSNTGKESQKAKDFCERFRNEPGYTVIEYRTQRVGPKENERNKHQMMIEAAKGLKCTHFYLSATDHFYLPNQFEYAKTVAEKGDLDLTFTSMYTYYKFPEWQITPIEDYYMPFITKIYPDTKIIINSSMYPLRVDPSVRVNRWSKWILFDESEVMLHHYSMVRDNIREKLMNSASSFKYEVQEAHAREHDNYDLEANPGVSYFKGRKIKVVPNYFDL